MTFASVTIQGRLTARPELRHTASGVPVTNFTVAHTPRTRDASTGKYEDSGDTLFLRVTAWRDLAEHVVASLDKGHMVTVTGRLGVREYVNAADQARTDVTCDADTVAIDLAYQTGDVTRIARADGTRSDADAPQPLAV